MSLARGRHLSKIFLCSMMATAIIDLIGKVNYSIRQRRGTYFVDDAVFNEGEVTLEVIRMQKDNNTHNISNRNTHGARPHWYYRNVSKNSCYK